jgi:hypothetical protein
MSSTCLLIRDFFLSFFDEEVVIDVASFALGVVVVLVW